MERTNSKLDPEVLSTLVAAAFDGLVLSWLADPERTRAADALRLLADLLEARGDD
ncbi:TetR family transcriptional regulator C-terminal domain-containing protein [Nonomuraea sp. NPDC049714]|uniref:TetR family transcriptional regulator C-terminal domain-containing protein n=1 Tax=Nonomuraea sp. NPDC049714 TaxID=3364357 RepID=UPI0037896036